MRRVGVKPLVLERALDELLQQRLVVAALALRGVYRIIAAKIYDTLAFFPLIPENPFLHYVTAAILICGMLIGALGSTISLKRFLNA